MLVLIAITILIMILISDNVFFQGIIPNSFAHIFGHMAKSGDDKNFLVRVSYLEIYNEEV